MCYEEILHFICAMHCETINSVPQNQAFLSLNTDCEVWNWDTAPEFSHS